MTTSIVIRTKKPAQYFSGKVSKEYLPLDGYMWVVICQSYAGGGRKNSLLSVQGLKDRTKKMLLDKITSFAKKEKYILEINNSKK